MEEKPDMPEDDPEAGQESMEDAMAEAMAEAMGQAKEPPSDPSSLLASAAAALESIDDPEFEGPSQTEPAPGPVAQAAPSTVAHQSSDFGRAVLTIETPVAVVLAKNKISVDRLVNLVPGSMLTFDAHCDEPLTLEAGGHAFAVGETVKIGDKFGLRIRHLLDSAD